ncbi:EAL domain-containing protein [Pseudokineococcus marinus]|uniref:EAL domain-containing protein n=1 Tax=Pseudokineococcus marinus TaxID=351215 RepID=A0A849BMZ7_9ACTN|nr:EAL domain-containing protein [Pseudokineococcus marinus]NNH22723.1 EAL domain-containing protein [Pseudokineococcus marinus]
MSAHPGARDRPEVRRLLDAARIAVDMDASLVTLHDGLEEVAVATSSRSALLRGAVGRRTPLTDTICGQVVAGRLPRWIPDAGADPIASVLPVTRAHGIGSYVGTPLHDDDGHVAGMLCCLSRAPDDRIGPDAPAVLESLASALSVALGLARRPAAAPEASPPVADASRGAPPSALEHHRAVLSLARGEDVDVLFEPVVDLATDRPLAFAAAFRAAACRGAAVGDVVGAHGLAGDVELACLHRALEHQGRQPPGTALAVAVSRSLLQRPGVVDLLLEHARSGLWVAVGHGAADDGATYERARRLREAGAVLAVDGAGTPSSGLVDALRLGPPLVSVCAPALDHAEDAGGADAQPDLVRALLAVTRSVGARLVVRDVTTAAQLEALRSLGVPLARGAAVGGPAPLPAA